MSLDTSAALQTFFEEARELLVTLEEGLLSLEHGENAEETINSIFRAAHTIKGSAGLFGLEPVVRFAHAAETLLDQVRARQVHVTAPVLQSLLAAKDHLTVLLNACEHGEPIQHDQALADELLAHAGQRPVTSTPAASTAAPARRRFSVHAAFGPEVLKDGMDPLSFVRFLESRGHIEQLKTDFSSLPLGDHFEPERCYLTLELVLETLLERRAVEEVFDFVKDTSDIRVTELEREAAPSEPRTTPPPTPRPSAPTKASTDRADHHTIKVRADKLDLLVNLVGELVIAGATSSVLGARTRDVSVVESLSALNQLIAGIRDSALGLRMVQIGDTFSRFRRVARDTAQQLGKRVELDIVGGETELDKAMVERLADPLLHLVRNALGHGIETPAERRAAGKDEVGHLALEAFHESGSIVIEVRDDGAGLNRARIFKKAVAQGLVSADEQLTDEELAQLIFVPGFSSAEKVTDLSGRGVGMDVVRRSIDELRGTIDVQSTEGQGTTIRLRLPLTLAIIDGFLVGVGRASYVVPMGLVRECVDLAPVLESEWSHRLDLRGDAVPFIRLRDLFRLPGDRPARESVVVVEFGEASVGLVVDRLLGASQTVIKPLGPLFRKTKGLEGSTILGSGEVALILDVPQIIKLVAGKSRSSAPSAAA
jgi:two-component system chemotaxis sensor kinase CheA